jgi:hypothetical protein
VSGCPQALVSAMAAPDNHIPSTSSEQLLALLWCSWYGINHTVRAIDEHQIISTLSGRDGVASASEQQGSLGPEWVFNNETRHIPQSELVSVFATDVQQKCWNTNGVVPQWVQFEFNDAMRANRYALRKWTSIPEAPRAWQLLGSESSNGPWTELDSRTEIDWEPGGQVKEFDILWPSTHKVYRLMVVEVLGRGTDTTNYIQVADLWFYGYLPTVTIRPADLTPRYAHGCTDHAAANYDPGAAANDGSCAYDCDALVGDGADAACYVYDGVTGRWTDGTSGREASWAAVTAAMLVVQGSPKRSDVGDPTLVLFNARPELHNQSLSLRHVRVEENVAFGGGGTDHGAAMSLVGSTCAMEVVDFTGNTQRGVGAGVVFAAASNATISLALFEKNQNLGLGAGVLSASGGSRVAFSHAQFLSNFVENQMGLSINERHNSRAIFIDFGLGSNVPNAVQLGVSPVPWINLQRMAQNEVVDLLGGVTMTALDERFMGNNLGPPDASHVFVSGDVIVPPKANGDYFYKVGGVGTARMRIDGLRAGTYRVTVFEGRTTDRSQFGKIWSGDEPSDEPTQENTGNFAGNAANAGTVVVDVQNNQPLWYMHLEVDSGGTSGMMIIPILFDSASICDNSLRLFQPLPQLFQPSFLLPLSI